MNKKLNVEMRPKRIDFPWHICIMEPDIKLIGHNVVKFKKRLKKGDEKNIGKKRANNRKLAARSN